MSFAGCQHQTTTHAEARMGTAVVCVRPEDAQINRKPGTGPGGSQE